MQVPGWRVEFVVGVAEAELFQDAARLRQRQAALMTVPVGDLPGSATAQKGFVEQLEEPAFVRRQGAAGGGE